jgi:hypothetical protein
MDSGIVAVVDLALEEPPAHFIRELAYFRLPLTDGAGNPPWLLRAAVDTMASLLRSNTPVLVSCGAGMSRSPAIAAAAIAEVYSRPIVECLELTKEFGVGDVTPAFWLEMLESLVLTSPK